MPPWEERPALVASGVVAAGAVWLGGQVAQVYPFGGSYVNEAVRLLAWDSPRPDLRFGCGPGARYEMFVTGCDKLAEYDARVPVFRISRYDSDLLRIYRTP